MFPSTKTDIRNSINKVRHAFNTLRPIWRATSLSLQNKFRIFGTNVKTVLLYDSETWRVTKTNTYKLQTFINQGCKWHYKKFSENAGVQRPHRPWWGQGATPLWGAQRGNAPYEKLNFHTSTA